MVFLVLSGFLFDVFPLICSMMDEMELFQRKIGNWDGTRSFLISKYENLLISNAWWLMVIMDYGMCNQW